ncbi:hypothetical protein GA0061078_1391 [Bifidobacterium bohemicum]|uniref:Uncharacterized protein n=1 Tax=Bifidobacterium bohemicum DSM 22767 TaxID=1437606 RepID=A0A086ZGT2_9BIFI|nr:hypothetical protein [Bifidobacterium bohemicum]KFI45732.1 hypothetical protein BBOH_0534 [Bifidobacterium bohemicum DSM 22767]SCC08188.1 hypothetical protein GA0061078_1391 [Bifidobacterium bohemicum]
MLHDIRYLLQSLRDKAGLHVLVALVYALVFTQLVHSDFIAYGAFDPHVFFGMFRVSDDPNIANLPFNVSSVMFMAFGLALPLGRFSRYLMAAEPMVYVRKRRGVAHFLLYLASAVAYCVMFTVVQLVATFALRGDTSLRSQLPGAVCAAGVLLLLMLIVGAGHLLGSAVMGYLAAALVYAAVLSFGKFDGWLIASGACSVPHWAPVLLLCVVGLAVLDTFLLCGNEMY